MTHPAAGVMSVMASSAPHYWMNSMSLEIGGESDARTILIEPCMAPSSESASQKHSPEKHGLDQSFAPCTSKGKDKERMSDASIQRISARLRLKAEKEGMVDEEENEGE